MQKQISSIILKRIVPLFCIVIVIIFIFFFLNSFSPIEKSSFYVANPADDRTNHVLVIGTSENSAFLKEVYKGAMSKGDENDAVVELLVSESRAEDVPLQTLLNYAGYECVDGIIAYVRSSDVNIIPPSIPEGEKIPLVSVGYYDADLPQISYIGTGYYEMGRLFAKEIDTYLEGNGVCLIINPYEKNDVTYSTLMNGLQNRLSESKNIAFTVFEIDDENIASVDDLLNQKIVSLKNVDVLVTLSQESTIRTAEAVINMNKVGNLGIIGVQESDEVRDYLDKGIVSTLLSFNPTKIGETAMDELFEYKKNGSANSYIMSDIIILHGDKK